VTNSFVYTQGARPEWKKTFTASDGEVFSVSLVFDNAQERAELTVEEAFAHLENLVQYLKDLTNQLQIVGFEESPPNSRYPFNPSYDEIDWTLDEINRWWNWAYYNDAFDPETPTDEPA